MKGLFRNLLAGWVRLHRLGAEIGSRRAVERQLAELDARTLRDIGLEAWRSPLGARVETMRQERMRWSTRFVGFC